MCDALRVARDVDKWHIEAYGVAIDYIDESNPSAGFELQFNLWYTINGPLNHFTLYLLDPKTNDDPKVAYDRAMGML